jgi:DNA polymerase III subunit delta
VVETIVGKNTFMIDDVLKRRARDFVNQYDSLGLERYDAEDTPASVIIDALLSLPFLLTKKLIIISNPSANKELVEQIPKCIERIPEENDVVFVEPRIDKRTAFYTFLKKQTKLTDYSELDTPALAQWLVARAKEKDFVIDTKTALFLIQRVGANQLLLDQELKKLGLYDSVITKQTVELLTEPAPQSKIFELLDAFLSASPKRTIELYRDQRAQRVEPMYILSMLVWQLQNIALAVHAQPKTEQSLVAAGMSPYTARNALRLSSSLSKDKLRQIVSDLAQVDRDIKTSADADHALELFLISGKAISS